MQMRTSIVSYMLIKIIKEFLGGVTLRGADGVGVVDRGTLEEDIWGELGALPRSRRGAPQHVVDRAAEEQLAHPVCSEGKQAMRRRSLLRPPAVAE
jgi:hypothetical protein